jgi:exosome complex exonuclease DIS3/RRP44
LRYGLEGLVKFNGEYEYDADNYSVTVTKSDGSTKTIGVFDKVGVEISVEKVSLT